MLLRRPLGWLLCLAGFVSTGARAQGLPAELTLAPVSGLTASLEVAATATLTYQKTADGRRLLAVAMPAGDTAGARAIDVTWQLTGTGEARPAVLLWEAGGGAWFKVSNDPLTAGARQASRLSLTGLREAAFSQSADQPLDLARAERLWVGVVLDGEAAGKLEISHLALTAEPWHPPGPLNVPVTEAKDWSVSKDQAVTYTLAIVPEGPAGEPVARFDYTFPAGRHMFFLPGRKVSGEELDGYRTLRIRYRATPFAGPNLLYMIQETGGGQWYADPAPAKDDTWQTLEVDLATLKLGSWSHDANNTFDLLPGSMINTGIHGTSAAGGTGTIWVQSIELVP